MSGVANRFKELMVDKNLNPASMAALLKEKRQRIVDISIGKQRIPEDIIIKLIEYFNINANWLMTGQGGMYRNQTKEESPSYEIKSLGALESLVERVETLEHEMAEMRRQA